MVSHVLLWWVGIGVTGLVKPCEGNIGLIDFFKYKRKVMFDHTSQSLWRLLRGVWRASLSTFFSQYSIGKWRVLLWGEREELRFLASVIRGVLWSCLEHDRKECLLPHLCWKTVDVPIKLKVSISSVNEFSWLYSSAGELSNFSFSVHDVASWS